MNNCREHRDSVLCLLLTHSDDTVISGSKDNSFIVISLSLSEVLYVKKEHDGPVTALCINKCGSILATGNPFYVLLAYESHSVCL